MTKRERKVLNDLVETLNTRRDEYFNDMNNSYNSEITRSYLLGCWTEDEFILDEILKVFYEGGNNARN